VTGYPYNSHIYFHGKHSHCPTLTHFKQLIIIYCFHPFVSLSLFERCCPVSVPLRFLFHIQLLIHNCSVVIEQWIVRVESDGFIIVTHSFVVVSDIIMTVASVFENTNIVRIESDGFVEIVNCILMLSKCSITQSPSIITFEVVVETLYGSCVFFNGFFVFSFFSEDLCFFS
jgi:hypothetical protein